MVIFETASLHDRTVSYTGQKSAAMVAAHKTVSTQNWNRVAAIQSAEKGE